MVISSRVIDHTVLEELHQSSMEGKEIQQLQPAAVDRQTGRGLSYILYHSDVCLNTFHHIIRMQGELYSHLSGA